MQVVGASSEASDFLLQCLAPPWPFRLLFLQGLLPSGKRNFRVLELASLKLKGGPLPTATAAPALLRLAQARPSIMKLTAP